MPIKPHHLLLLNSDFMSKIKREFESFAPASRAEWRQWLADNHTTSDRLWLIYYKKESGKPSLSYDEAVEEALCFGWIDSVVNKVDAERYKQLFSPRKVKSNWSRLNKERVARLIEQGLMMPSGLAKIEAAKQDGTWTALDAVEDLVIPEDLVAAFASQPVARANFDAFSRSVKRGILEWLLNAKRPETRAKRIAEIVAKAERNLRANFDRD
jgi:uncharacterized protein YdeI (YjbR/CyaY-like superfamily)